MVPNIEVDVLSFSGRCVLPQHFHYIFLSSEIKVVFPKIMLMADLSKRIYAIKFTDGFFIDHDFDARDQF